MVQGKLVTMVEEENENFMLAAQVTLQDSGAEKRPQKKGTKQAVSQLVETYLRSLQAHKFNDMTSEVMYEFKNILVLDEIQHAMPSVSQKSQQGFQHPDLMQLPGPKTSDPIGEMTHLNNDTISTKVTPCTTQEAFVDPFPKDLETLFFEEYAVSAKFAIADKGALKQISAMVEDINWPVLVDLGS